MELPNDQNTIFENVGKHTRHSLNNLWQIIRKHGVKGNKKSTSKARNKPLEIDDAEIFSLKILRIIPGLLLLTFIISFFWDFNNISYHLFNHTFHFEGFLRMLSVGGLIGYGTNWLAITMLFKPVNRHPLLGHGLIPAQKERISIRLAQAVSEDLINPEIIKQQIKESNAISLYRRYSTRYIKNIIDDPNFRQDIKVWTVQYVNDMIANPEVRSAIASKILIQIETSIQNTTLEKAALRTYTFVKGQKMQQIIEEALTRLPDTVEGGLDRFDIFLDNLPNYIEKRSDVIEQVVTSLLYALVNQLNVQKLVEDKLQQYDEQHISNLIQNATNEQLQYIQYLGAVLGVIGGLIIWEPLYCLILLFILTAGIFVIDYLWMNYFLSPQT